MYQVITLIEGAFHVFASSDDLNVAESILKFCKLADNENAYAIYDMKNSEIRNYELPETFHGFPVVDGDKSDDQMLDLSGGTVLGLKAKGKARKDVSGFVVK